MKSKKLFLFTIILLFIGVILSACGSSDMFSIEFYVDGDFYKSFWVKNGESFSEYVEVPEKEGMIGSWSVEDLTSLTKDTQVDAIYITAYCDVTFVVDGVKVEVKKIKKGSSLSQATLPQPTPKEGYVATWDRTNFNKITQDMVVTAVYTPQILDINFYHNENDVESYVYNYGSDILILPTLRVIDGKDLTIKWVEKTIVDDEIVYTEATFDNLVDNKNYVAFYSVDVAIDDKISDSRSQNIEIGTYEDATKEDLDITFNQPTIGENEGYMFGSWYWDEEYNQKIEFPAEVESNTTIFAHWLEEDTTFSEIVVDENGVVTSCENSADVIIPNFVGVGEDKKQVTSLAESLFSDNTTINTISLPSSIKTIKNDTFKNCTNLEEIIVRDSGSFNEILSNAFSGCVLLENIPLSKYLTKIEEYAFESCYSLKDFGELNEATLLEVIPQYAFANTGADESNAVQLNLPKNIKSIADYAFYNTKYEVNFDENNLVESLGDYAFSKALNTKNLIFKELKSVGDRVYEGCTGLKGCTTISDLRLFEMFGNGTDIPQVDISECYEVNFDIKTYYVPVSLTSVFIASNKKIEDTQLASNTIINNAFYNCSSIKNVELDKDIEVIDEKAFYINDAVLNAENFVITINEGVKVIKDMAFLGRSDLKAINIPSSLETIGEKAFYSLTMLKEINVANNPSLSNSGRDAFSRTQWLVESRGMATIGKVLIGFGNGYMATTNKSVFTENDFDGINTIAPYSFQNYTKLAKVILPASIKIVGEGAFYKCDNLTELYIDSNITNVGKNIVNSCKNLKNITISSDYNLVEMFGEVENTDDYYAVTKEDKTYHINNKFANLTILAGSEKVLKSGVYSNFTSLNSIIVGEGIEDIEDLCFSGNTNLESIEFSSTITNIGKKDTSEETAQGVFKGSNMLNNIVFAENSKLQTIGEKAFSNISIINFDVTDMLTTIGNHAFENTTIEELVISENSQLSVIGDYAFSNCQNLNNVNLPASLLSLGAYAFNYNTSLVNINLEEGLENIGEYAFNNCSLKSIVFPSSVKFFDEETQEYLLKGVLANNTQLVSLTLYQGILISHIFDNTTPENLEKITQLGGDVLDSQYADLDTINEVVLENVAVIGDYAFMGNSFGTIVIPDSVVGIGDYAFSNNVYLEEFRFALTEVFTTVGSYVFSGNTSLKNVTFPKSVANVNWEGVFDGCTSLLTAVIPDSVVDLGENTYRNCTSLESIILSDNLKSIGTSAFENDEKLVFSNMDFENLLTLGSKAFKNCKLLNGFKAINIESIGESAFVGCDYLSEMTIIEEKLSAYVGMEIINNIKVLNVSSKVESALAIEVAEELITSASLLKTIVLNSKNQEIIELSINNLTIESDVIVFIDEAVYDNLDDSIVSGEKFDKIYPTPYNFSESNFVFDEENREATLVSYDTILPVVSLPSHIIKNDIEYEVTSVGDFAFVDADIKMILIPSSITSIGSGAFKNNQQLASVVFEAGSMLEVIKDDAFANCVNLESIILPDEATSIGYRAFYNNTKLSAVTISQNSQLEIIGDYAFNKTISLTNFAITSKLSSLGEGAFMESGLITFSFGKNAIIKQIKEKTFMACNNLITCVLPLSVVEVAIDAFLGTQVSLD